MSKTASPSKNKSGTTLTTKSVVMQALRSTEDRNGLSLLGLRAYVARNHPALAEKKHFKTNMKKCLLRGLETGELTRPKKSEDCTGLKGFFKLVPAKPKVAERQSRPKSDDSKAVEAKSKSPRRPQKPGKSKASSASRIDAAKAKGKKGTHSRSASPGRKKVKETKASASRSRSPSATSGKGKTASAVAATKKPRKATSDTKVATNPKSSISQTKSKAKDVKNPSSSTSQTKSKAKDVKNPSSISQTKAKTKAKYITKEQGESA